MNCKHQQGSTYVETLAAVVLVGIATLIAGSLLNLHPSASSRLDAQAEALQAVEATLESVRAGAIPLNSGVVNDPPVDVRSGMKVSLSVNPQTTPDLYLIRVKASCVVHGQTIERHASTMLWRPS